MRAIEILVEEHRRIARMLDGLQRILERASMHGRLDAEPASELLSFFLYFADGLHQEREERCLFPRLLHRASCVDERLAIARLCGDHEQERRSLRALGASLLGAIYGEPRSLGDFAREGALFVQLHRRHLAHENLELLPLAERMLAPEDDLLIRQGFAVLEREGGHDLPALFERIERLCERAEAGAATPSQH